MLNEQIEMEKLRNEGADVADKLNEVQANFLGGGVLLAGHKSVEQDLSKVHEVGIAWAKGLKCHFVR